MCNVLQTQSYVLNAFTLKITSRKLYACGCVHAHAGTIKGSKWEICVDAPMHAALGGILMSC